MADPVIRDRQGTRVARRGRRLALAVMAILAIAALTGAAAWAAFVATTESAGNLFSSGTVALSDNDGGTALLSLTGARPGDFDSGCITVNYTGSLAASVRLYGSTTGTGLDEYLNLTITRGSFSGSPPAFDDCTGFTADGTDYIGLGSGVIYSGTLRDFPDTYAAGLVDPLPGAPESWTSGEAHTYKFRVSLQDNPLAQAKDAAQTFTWEARND